MSEGISSKLPARKEWDCNRYDCGNTAEADGYESSDYVDGWNDALDAVEQGTAETVPTSKVFDDMMTSLSAHPPVETFRGKVPQALIDVVARDEDTRAFVLRTVSEIKHDARTSSMIGCLFSACAGATSILLGAPGIVVALATYGSGVCAGWLAALLISIKRGRAHTNGGRHGDDRDQGT